MSMAMLLDLRRRSLARPAPDSHPGRTRASRASTLQPSRLDRNQGDLSRAVGPRGRSEEHTSELQSLMRISYAVFCLKKKNDSPLILGAQVASLRADTSRLTNLQIIIYTHSTVYSS